jgi:general secretion pathway protein A
MFEAFYGLREKPFNLTPDPKFLYLSEKHKEAFAHLMYGIKNRSGFVMLTGEIGTGKTTICRNLLSQLESDTELAFIFNPFLSPIELLRKINSEFGIDTRADNLLGLTEELNIHLLNAGARGKNCVLVIDEAQNLDVKVLEQIRLLSNLETESSKLIQIILIGQPELAEKLALHELRQLNQRITARYHLKPLNETETLQYVAYRIHVAGGRKTVNFSKGAIRQVYRLSGGTPRMVNAICDRALLIGYTCEEHMITAAIVRQAAREIKGEKVVVNRPGGGRRWTRWLPSPAMLLAAILLIVIVQVFANPVDRMARELGLFNRLLSGETPAVTEAKPAPAAVSAAAASDKTPVPPAPVPTPAVVAPVAAPTAELSPATESMIARRVIERLASVSAAHGVTLQDSSLKNLEDLGALSPEASRDAGLGAVLKAWGVEQTATFSGGDTAEGLSQFLAGRGLACESLHPGTVQLAAINLPALVRVKVKDQPRWAALVRADEDLVTLALDGDRSVSLGRTTFRDIYQGEAVIPWRDTTPKASLLLPGQKGAQVATLKQQLRGLGLIDSKNTQDNYDGETASAVTALQAETGLKMDGKAGRQVRMVLAAWSGANNSPSLRPRTGAVPAVDSPAKHEDKPVAPGPPANSAPQTPAAAVSEPAPAEAAKSEPPAPGPEPSPATAGQEIPVSAPPEAVKSETPGTAAPPETAKPEAPAPAETSEKKEQSAARVSAGEYRAEGGAPLQVRELPPPTAMEPLPPAETVRPGESTEPVAGSSPLVPHGGASA